MNNAEILARAKAKLAARRQAAPSQTKPNQPSHADIAASLSGPSKPKQLSGDDLADKDGKSANVFDQLAIGYQGYRSRANKAAANLIEMGADAFGAPKAKDGEEGPAVRRYIDSLREEAELDSGDAYRGKTGADVAAQMVGGGVPEAVVTMALTKGLDKPFRAISGASKVAKLLKNDTVRNTALNVAKDATAFGAIEGAVEKDAGKALHGATTGAVLGSLSPLKARYRIPGGAAVMGGDAALSGGTETDIGTSALVGGAMSIMGGPGKKGKPRLDVEAPKAEAPKVETKPRPTRDAAVAKPEKESALNITEKGWTNKELKPKEAKKLITGSPSEHDTPAEALAGISSEIEGGKIVNVASKKGGPKTIDEVIDEVVKKDGKPTAAASPQKAAKVEAGVTPTETPNVAPGPSTSETTGVPAVEPKPTKKGRPKRKAEDLPDDPAAYVEDDAITQVGDDAPIDTTIEPDVPVRTKPVRAKKVEPTPDVEALKARIAAAESEQAALQKQAEVVKVRRERPRRIAASIPAPTIEAPAAEAPAPIVETPVAPKPRPTREPQAPEPMAPEPITPEPATPVADVPAAPIERKPIAPPITVKPRPTREVIAEAPVVTPATEAKSLAGRRLMRADGSTLEIVKQSKDERGFDIVYLKGKDKPITVSQLKESMNNQGVVFAPDPSDLHQIDGFIRKASPAQREAFAKELGIEVPEPKAVERLVGEGDDTFKQKGYSFELDEATSQRMFESPEPPMFTTPEKAREVFLERSIHGKSKAAKETPEALAARNAEGQATMEQLKAEGGEAEPVKAPKSKEVDLTDAEVLEAVTKYRSSNAYNPTLNKLKKANPELAAKAKKGSLTPEEAQEVVAFSRKNTSAAQLSEYADSVGVGKAAARSADLADAAPDGARILTTDEGTFTDTYDPTGSRPFSDKADDIVPDRTKEARDNVTEVVKPVPDIEKLVGLELTTKDGQTWKLAGFRDSGRARLAVFEHGEDIYGKRSKTKLARKEDILVPEQKFEAFVREHGYGGEVPYTQAKFEYSGKRLTKRTSAERGINTPEDVEAAKRQVVEDAKVIAGEADDAEDVLGVVMEHLNDIDSSNPSAAAFQIKRLRDLVKELFADDSGTSHYAKRFGEMADSVAEYVGKVKAKKRGGAEAPPPRADDLIDLDGPARVYTEDELVNQPGRPRPKNSANIKPDDYVNLDVIFGGRAARARNPVKERITRRNVQVAVDKTGQSPKEVMSNELRDSKAAGMTREDVIALKEKVAAGKQLDVHEVRATHMQVAKMADEISNGIASINTIEGGWNDKAKVQALDTMYQQFDELMSFYPGVRTYAGRLLASFKAIAKTDAALSFDPYFWGKAIERRIGNGYTLNKSQTERLLILSNKGKIAADDFIKKFQAENGRVPTRDEMMAAAPIKEAMEELTQFSAKISKTPIFKAMSNWLRAGYLTGPWTTAYNVTSNATHQLMREAEQYTAGWTDAAITKLMRRQVNNASEGALADLARKLNGGKSLKYESIDELRDYVISKSGRTRAGTGGFINALRVSSTRGIEEASFIMKRGVSPEDLGKLERHWDQYTGDRAASKLIDVYVNSVFRFMGAQDRPFRVMAAERALDELALVKAINEVSRKGGDVQELAARFRKAPDKVMLAEAWAAAEEAVFANATSTNKVTQALRSGAVQTKNGDRQWAGFLFDSLIPFSRTPSALIEKVLEFSPMGLSSGVAKLIKSGGLMTPQEQQRIATLVGRGLVGTAIMSIGAILEDKGMMTGMYDKDTEPTLRADGLKSGLMQVGPSAHLDVNRLGPIGMMLLVGGEMSKMIKNVGKGDGFWEDAVSVGGAVTAPVRAVSDAPLMAGIDTVKRAYDTQGDNVIEQLAAGAKQWAKNTAGAVVPASAGMRWLGDQTDTSRREVDTPLDSIKANIPGVRKSLPEKVDPLGADVDPQSGLFTSKGGVTSQIRELGLKIPAIKKLPDESAEEYSLRSRAIGELRSLALEGVDLKELGDDAEQFLKDAMSVEDPVSALVRDPDFRALPQAERVRQLREVVGK